MERELLDIYGTWGTEGILYQLLSEQDFKYSISHRKMPTYPEHLAFVSSHPYKEWFLIRSFKRTEKGGVYDVLGAVYLTYRHEIGIRIFKAHQRKGHAEWAVRELMRRLPGVRRFLANINPHNTASLALFKKMGYTPLQVTYALERGDDQSIVTHDDKGGPLSDVLALHAGPGGG